MQVPSCRWGAPLRAAPRFCPPGPWTLNPARPSRAGARGGEKRMPQRRGGLAPGPPRPTTFLRVLPRTPRPRTPHPSLAARRGAATPALSLEGVEGWVWGRGRVWGRTRRRGCLCGKAQLGSPPPPGLSLSLLLPPPAPGGARHGGAGARQARYGDVEIGEAWCREVGWGNQGQGGFAGRVTEKSRVTGQGEGEGCPGTWGLWMERGVKPARFGTNREGRGRQ